MKQMTSDTQKCFILWKLFLVLPSLMYFVGIKLSAYLYDHERFGRTNLWNTIHEMSFLVFCVGQFICWFCFIVGCVKYIKSIDW